MVTTEERYLNTKSFTAVLMALAILTGLIRILPFLFPDSRLWGINHLIFVDNYWSIAIFSGIIVAVIAFLPPLRVIVSRWFERPAEYMFGSESPAHWLVVSFLSLLVFWLLRMPTNLLGDGYTVINNIAGDLPVVFKWSEFGAVRVIHFVSRLIPIEGLGRAEYAFAIVSVISGTVTIFFFCGLAYELGRDLSTRLVLLCLLLFSGWTLLFFGYAENYPVLWPFMTGYLYFGLRYIQGLNSLILPIIFVLIAALLHLQTIFFLLSLPILLISRGKGQSFYRRHSKILLIAAGIVCIAAVTAFVYKYLTALEFMIHFLPPFSGRPPMTDYAMFSPKHLLDILNEMSLLIPVWPILLMVALWGKRESKTDAVDRFLLAFSVGGAILLFILDPRIGMGRDWDLFALTGLGPLLYLSRKCFQSASWRPISWPAVALLALALTFPYFATNLSYQPSIDYMKSLLRLDMPKSKSGLVMLRDYYRNIDDNAISDSLNREIATNFPLIRIADQIYGMVEGGETDRALAIADSAFRADPYSSETHNILGMVHFRRGEYARAIKYYSQSARLKPYDSRVLSNMATSYQQLGDNERMMDCLYRAYKLAPEKPHILEGLSRAYYSRRVFDSAFFYAEKFLQVDSNNPRAYLAAGMSSFGLRNKNNARLYLRRYVETAPDGQFKDIAIEMLKQIE